jgi:hypothetical protein
VELKGGQEIFKDAEERNVPSDYLTAIIITVNCSQLAYQHEQQKVDKALTL